MFQLELTSEGIFKQVLNFRYIIFYIIFFIFSCEENIVFDNPLDEQNNPNFMPPETLFINQALEGSTLDTSSVTIDWTGGDLVQQYKYKLNQSDWSNWSADTTITLNYLDEGDYTFSVLGRYSQDIEEEIPAEVNFSVDMVQGPGIRIFPLLQEFDWTGSGPMLIEIYGEEVDGLVLISFQLEYDQNIINISSDDISLGTLITDTAPLSSWIEIYEEIDDGLIEINFSLLAHEGVSGTGSLFSIEPVVSGTWGSSPIKILNPQFGDVYGNQIQVIDSANGMVTIGQ